MKALSLDGGEAAVRGQPLHGVGIELPDGDAPKINLYLQAAM